MYSLWLAAEYPVGKKKRKTIVAFTAFWWSIEMSIEDTAGAHHFWSLILRRHMKNHIAQLPYRWAETWDWFWPMNCGQKYVTFEISSAKSCIPFTEHTHWPKGATRSRQFGSQKKKLFWRVHWSTEDFVWVRNTLDMVSHWHLGIVYHHGTNLSLL